MKKFLVLPIPVLLIFLSGCDWINPIRNLDCKTTKSFLSVGDKLQNYKFHPADPNNNPLFIINRNSGDIYEIDDFTGKLELITGTTELEGDTYQIRTDISKDIWKIETVSIYSPKQSQDDSKETTRVNLKTMKYETEAFAKVNGVWDLITVSEGICKWEKPETTEILKKA